MILEYPALHQITQRSMDTRHGIPGASWDTPALHGKPAVPSNTPAAVRTIFNDFLKGVEAMLVGDIMTARVVTVEMDDKLEIVKQIFDSLSFHHLLVVDQRKKLSGVISDRDLLRALSPYVGGPAETARDLATLSKRVHQIMSRNPHTLPPHASLAEAGRVLIEFRISCIPIVDDDCKPVGIVSWRDVLRSLLEELKA